MPQPFDSIPPTPNGHFLLHFYGTILRLLRYIDRMGAFGEGSQAGLNAQFPFLAHYREQIELFLPPGIPPEKAVTWWEEEVGSWQARVPVYLPLTGLEGMKGIGSKGRAALMAAGLVEEDSRLGTVLAHLQEPLLARRPTLELVGQLLAEDGGAILGGYSEHEVHPAQEAHASNGSAWEITRELFQMGALETMNPDAPRAEWVLRVPALIWDAVRGALDGSLSGQWTLHPLQEYPELDQLILPDELIRRLHQVPALLQAGQARVLVVRASPGSDRLRVAGATARAMGRQVIEIPPQPARSPDTAEAAPNGSPPERILGILCTLALAVPIFTFDLGPGETASVPDLPGYDGPVMVLMGGEGGLNGTLADQSLMLPLPLPSLNLRLRYWQAALETTPAENLEEIARRFILPGGYIRQTASMAVAQARLEGRQVVTPEAVRQAARALNRQMLDSLTERIEAGGAWSDLVVGAGTLTKLRELEQRCHYREQLLEHLGPAFGNTSNHGVRALFSGASGTGKTLAARILASELGMDLYRVDLASVINKYIGETEKNLHRVLSRAEELDVVLLLDEGDALLGNRTDVKSSNDRYANLETNYLLQRLENYQGIIVVTSNAAQNIDTAFQRRMDVVVNFVPPQVDERLSIWQLHLPAGNDVHPEFMGRIAAQCSLTGGQIRNAALLATLLAVQEGANRVQDRHLEAAIRAEYRKAGAVCPLGQDLPVDNRPDSIFDLIRLIS